MINERAKAELTKILGSIEEYNLRKIAQKLKIEDFRGIETKDELIEVILRREFYPSEILRQQEVYKSTLIEYCKKNYIQMKEEEYKHEYIKKLLEIWQVEGDPYLRKWRFLTKERIFSELDNFEAYMNEKKNEIYVLKQRIEEGPIPVKELEKFQESNGAFIKAGGEKSEVSEDSPSDDDSFSLPCYFK